MRFSLIAAALLIAASVATATLTTAAAGSGCTECTDKAYCCDGESCCSGGSFCCPSTSTCCQDTCCDKVTESCCADPVNGDVCCMKETTFCCPPQPMFDLPSRCCPRWYVCCNDGRFGCCDPDTGVPSEELEAYALFLEPTWLGPMVFQAATIDVKSGTRTEVHVDGFHTEQETTRTFMFDKTLSRFYLLQANFTAPQNNSGPPTFPINLFTINPATGETTQTLVQGAQNEVTGFRFLQRRRIIVMSTWWYLTPSDSDEEVDGKATASSSSTSPAPSGSGSNAPVTPVGYIFYHVDVSSGAAIEVGRVANTNGTDSYAGWFHESSDDGMLLYRLGYQDVVQSINFGIGVVNLSNVPATVSWTTLPRPDGTHGHYRTLNLWHANGPLAATLSGSSNNSVVFLSLAPSYNLTRYGDLSLFAWSLADPFGAVKVATFPNAHTTPEFGPISECISFDERYYAAVFVQDSPLGKDFDTYGIGLARLDGGKNSSSKEVMLTPQMVAVTVSVSGLGIPANSSVWSMI